MLCQCQENTKPALYRRDIQVLEIRVVCGGGEQAQVDGQPVSITVDILSANCSNKEQNRFTAPINQPTTAAQVKAVSPGHCV